MNRLVRPGMIAAAILILTGSLSANAVILNKKGEIYIPTRPSDPHTAIVEVEQTETEPENVTETVAEETTPVEEPEQVQQELTIMYEDEKIRFMKNGEYIKNRFVFYDGDAYRMDENGYAKSGFNEVYGKTYYFGNNGKARTGWVFDDDKWYYLENGSLMTGWQEIDGEKYYFGEDGILFEGTETPDGALVDENGRQVSAAVDENRETFTWDKDREEIGPISGLMIAGHPAELYMLSTAGETSGFSNKRAIVAGDRGRAYGICQFDYRYDLVDFMNYAYGKHPQLWAGFEPYIGLRSGSSALVYNEGIGNAFIAALQADFETCITDQMEMFNKLYWDETENAMNAAGFNMGERHIAVSAAIFSINVNCGPHTSLYLRELSPDMTDEEMIRKLYHLRNTVMAQEHVGSVRKGTSTRYLSAEPQMALDLLYGYTTIDSHIVYGGGVEWHGNPFIADVSTIANLGSVKWKGLKPDDEMMDEVLLQEVTVLEEDDTMPGSEEESTENETESTDAGGPSSDTETTAVYGPGANIPESRPAVVYSPGAAALMQVTVNETAPDSDIQQTAEISATEMAGTDTAQTAAETGPLPEETLPAETMPEGPAADVVQETAAMPETLQDAMMDHVAVVTE